MNLLEKLNWRYAAKRMTGKQIPEDKITRILEAIRLAPSAFGLQPYHILVIENAELKAKIHAAACTQAQIVECSHLLVFASWNSILEKEVDAFIEHTASTRAMPIEKLTGLKSNLLKISQTKIAEQVQAWTAKQAYIALGVGLIAAAEEEIDATPMEGFNAELMDEVLELKETNLHATVILALGYRDMGNDWLLKLKKVRKPKEKLFTIID